MLLHNVMEPQQQQHSVVLRSSSTDTHLVQSQVQAATTREQTRHLHCTVACDDDSIGSMCDIGLDCAERVNVVLLREKW